MYYTIEQFQEEINEIWDFEGHRHHQKMVTIEVGVVIIILTILIGFLVIHNAASLSAQSTCFSSQSVSSISSVDNCILYTASDVNNTNPPVQVVPRKVAEQNTPLTHVTVATNLNAQKGTGDYFPSGQCTDWASYRYHQLTGIYVPWTINSDAWEWPDRAREFGWTVSATPQVGDIIALGPFQQGAGRAGHVAIVEQIYSDGSVLATNLNWGYTDAERALVAKVHFYPDYSLTTVQNPEWHTHLM